MSAGTYDVCVLGAGPGGYAAAMRAHDLGKRVVLVERDRVGVTVGDIGELDAHAASCSGSAWRMRQPISCLTASVASASNASSEATANAAVRLYSL